MSRSGYYGSSSSGAVVPSSTSSSNSNNNNSNNNNVIVNTTVTSTTSSSLPVLANFGAPPGAYSLFAHGTGTCDCPACDLAQRYAVVYQKQFPAMTPESAEANKIQQAMFKNKNNASCEMWSAYGFCFHGLTCMFPHKNAPNSVSNQDAASPPATQSTSTQTKSNFKIPRAVLTDADRNRSVAELEVEIRKMIDEHSNDVFRCRVCAYDGAFDPSCIIKVGEMYSYMTCPRCTSPLYQPLTLFMVEAVLRETGGKDHQAYKKLIDKLRSSLPHMVRIPLSFEAHRLASTYFGWSLVGPEEAAEALTAAICETPLPKASTIVSMGSGTGYIEHVFAEAIKLLPKRKSTCPKTGKELDDGVPVLSEARAQSFSVMAFDEILRESKFSVPVQMGTPDTINCLPDVKNTILLLCWPPFGSPGGPAATMGHDALRRFFDLGGKSVIYIGDVASTGDYDFHVLLQEAFRPCPSYRTRHDVTRWIPQEMGLVYAGNDTIGVYKKREFGDNFAYFAH
jgi:hypothetical protein